MAWAYARGIYARLEISPSWPPLITLIWGARSRDPVQVGYRCLRTLTSIGLLGLRVSSCSWAAAGMPKVRTRGVIPSSTYISTFYVHATSFAKNQHFLFCVKKTKKRVSCNAFLAPRFVFLHTTQKISFFIIQLCGHVEYRVLCSIFFVGTFWQFWTLFKTDFKNREHLPSAKTPSPL
jgi:hypothetical protein